MRAAAISSFVSAITSLASRQARATLSPPRALLWLGGASLGGLLMLPSAPAAAQTLADGPALSQALTTTAACPVAPSVIPNSPAPALPPPGQPTPAASLTTAWPPAPGLPPRCPAVPLRGKHATYNVGPGKQYTTLNAVPWLSLVAGDVVNIYYSPTPYATKFALRAMGTAAKPVIINGVADASGNLPVITGNNATTAQDAITQGYYAGGGGAAIEPLGVITIFRGPQDQYGYKAQHLIIQNLRITGAAPGNSFTDHSGAKVAYPTFTAGIYTVAAQYLTVQNDELDHNGIGIFVNDQNDLAGTSYYVTVRGSYIHDNGVVNNWSVHNLYVQGVRSLYEGNYIGQLIPGANGGGLKDRSSGPVVRYNTIVSAARAIDLVDSENGSTRTNNDKLYNYGWVYGNLIIDDFSLPGVSSGDLIHWGGDSTVYSKYHNGPLFFYNNTIVVKASKTQTYSLGLFDMASNQQTIIASNNIIAHTGNSLIYPCVASLSNGTKGTLLLQGTNWFTAMTSNGACTIDTSTANATLLPGEPSLTASYGLPAGSAAIGQGSAYSPGSITLPAPANLTNLQVTRQYTSLPGATVLHPSFTTRTTATDLGAFAYP